MNSKCKLGLHLSLDRQFGSHPQSKFTSLLYLNTVEQMMIQNQEQSLLVMIDPVALQTWSVIEEQNNT